MAWKRSRSQTGIGAEPLTMKRRFGPNAPRSFPSTSRSASANARPVPTPCPCPARAALACWLPTRNAQFDQTLLPGRLLCDGIPDPGMQFLVEAGYADEQMRSDLLDKAHHLTRVPHIESLRATADCAQIDHPLEEVGKR